MQRIKSISLIKVFSLASFVLITSGYPLSTVTGNNLYFSLIIPILALGIYRIQSPIGSNQFNIHNCAYLILVFLAFLSFIINANIEYFFTNIKYIMVITFAFLLTKIVSFNDFIKYYISIMKFIVIVSLFGYLFFSLLKFPINLPVFVNINGVEYYNGIVFFIIKGFQGSNILMENARNVGSFWEPGIFSTFIIIALIFEITIKKVASKQNIIIFCLGLISTFSTSGYLMLVLLIFIIIQKNLKGIKAGILFVLSICSFTIVYLNISKIVIYLYEFMPVIFGKFVVESASVTERISAPLTNLRIFNGYPLFGSGIGKVDGLFLSLTDASQTSTSTYYLAAFGLFGILYTGFLIYGILKYSPLNLYARLTVLLIILLQINKESHFYFTITYIIIFYYLKISSFKGLNR